MISFKYYVIINFYLILRKLMSKKVTTEELYDKTIERENKIKELGFNLVVMWENDFNG